jgi:hypothetical protein
MECRTTKTLGAVDATPADHPNRPTYLSNLGAALLTRFNRTGQKAALDQAIEMYREGAGCRLRHLSSAWKPPGRGACALLAGTPLIAVEGIDQTATGDLRLLDEALHLAGPCTWSATGT